MIPSEWFDNFEDQLSTDYEGRCGNCHSYLADGDQYCRHCGTRRGEGTFEPYRNWNPCIYGPMPIKRTHTCPVCRTAWVRELMVDEEFYCPHCGGRVTIEESRNQTSILDLQWGRDTQIYIFDTFQRELQNLFGRKFSSDRFTQISVGRTQSSDLIIPDNRISRRHALFVFEDNQWFIRDSGSGNGTTLNDYPLPPHINIPLSDGNIITFAGIASLRVRILP